MAEVVCSLEDAKGGSEGKCHRCHRSLLQQMSGPPRSRTPKRRDASRERSLTEVREAHQRALATVATLEGEIEWLSHSLIQSQPETQTHSCSRDHCQHRSEGQKRRHCQVQPEDCHAPCFKHDPPLRSPESGEEEAATKDLDLGEPPELGLEVTCFSGGQLAFWRRRM